jgi:hypothetical protein
MLLEGNRPHLRQYPRSWGDDGCREEAQGVHPERVPPAQEGLAQHKTSGAGRARTDDRQIMRVRVCFRSVVTCGVVRCVVPGGCCFAGFAGASLAGPLARHPREGPGPMLTPSSVALLRVTTAGSQPSPQPWMTAARGCGSHQPGRRSRPARQHYRHPGATGNPLNGTRWRRARDGSRAAGGPG